MNDWETKVRKVLFNNSLLDDPAVEVDMNFLRQCVAIGDISDREWFYNIFDRVPRSAIREALLTKKLPITQIILGCTEFMATQRQESSFRYELNTTNRIRSDHGQRKRGGPLG